jgi:hypothetical protein
MSKYRSGHGRNAPPKDVCRSLQLTSWPVTRTRVPALRTLPSTRNRHRVPANLLHFEKLALVTERGMSRDHAQAGTFERSVTMSSVIPSLKYSCSGSPLMFANGRPQCKDVDLSALIFSRPHPALERRHKSGLAPQYSSSAVRPDLGTSMIVVSRRDHERLRNRNATGRCETL